MLIGFALLFGVVLGLLLTAISINWVYLPFGFPLAVGFISEFLLNKTVEATKTRKVIQVWTAAIVMGCCVYGIYRVGDYLYFRDHPQDSTMIHWEKLSETERPALVSSNPLSLPDYLNFQLDVGIFLASGHVKLHLTDDLFLIFWLVELATIIYFPFNWASAKARKPFCEETDSWLILIKHGRVPGQRINELKQCLQVGDFYTLGTLILDRDSVWAPYVWVSSGRCAPDSLSATLILEEVEGELGTKKYHFGTKSMFITAKQEDQLLAGLQISRGR